MEKFDVAVIGAGGMGKTHIEAALASPHVQNVHVVDPNPDRVRALEREFKIIPASMERILQNPAVRFASIASPNEYHQSQTELCLRAGKAVLCEKPMGCSLAEAKKMLQIEKETKGFLQVGFELHYSKLYQLAKKWIADGFIGKPVNIQTRYFCSEFHRKNTWRSNSTGSFLIGEKLSHYLDMQRYFFDEKFENIYSLSSEKVVPYFHHRDNHQIMTRYPGGKIGVLNFIMYIAESYHEDPLREILEKQSQDGHELTYYICGTRGAIETNVFLRRIRRWEFSESETGFESRIAEDIHFQKKDDLEYFHNVFGQNLYVIDLFANGKKSEMTAEDAYETMKMCFAAELSEDSGKIIESSDPRL